MQFNPWPSKLFNVNPIAIRLWLVAIGRIHPPESLLHAAAHVARGLRRDRS